MGEFDLVPAYLAFALIGMAAVAVVSVVGTWIVVRLAHRRALLDVPNERSSHSVPTPRGGGIAIVVAALAYLALSRDDHLWGIGVAVLVAFGVGLLDDLWSLRPRLKMGGLIAASVIVLLFDRISVVRGVPFVGDVDLAWAAWPLWLFWLASYPNAFNFMDGLNGIAATTTIVSSCTYVIVGRDPSLVLVGATTAAATLGFLPWNFPRARIFMGDAGSLPLGLILAWCAVRANASGALAFPASILLLGPFIFDVTFTLVRRAARGARLGEAHKEHLYQRLSRVWGSHAKVSLLYAGFSVVTGVLALQYDGLSELGKLLSLVVPVASMLGFAALVLRAERSKGG